MLLDDIMTILCWTRMPLPLSLFVTSDNHKTLLPVYKPRQITHICAAAALLRPPLKGRETVTLQGVLTSRYLSFLFDNHRLPKPMLFGELGHWQMTLQKAAPKQQSVSLLEENKLDVNSPCSGRHWTTIEAADTWQDIHELVTKTIRNLGKKKRRFTSAGRNETNPHHQFLNR